MREPDHNTDESDDDEPSPHEKAMSFLDHLEDLRWTLIKSLIVFIIVFVVIAIFLNEARDALYWPLRMGLGPERAASFRLVTPSPMAVFSTLITMCVLASVPVALPFILYFIGQFVAPALTKREMRMALPVCTVAVILFLAGGSFSFFFLVPSVVRISMEYAEWLQSEFLWQVDNYFSMLTWMTIGMGAAFQFPLILLIAVYLNIVTVEALRSWRRIVVIVCFVLAAIITPTQDFLTMTIVALPLWLLYEAALVVAGIYSKRRAAREAQEEAENS